MRTLLVGVGTSWTYFDNKVDQQKPLSGLVRIGTVAKGSQLGTQTMVCGQARVRYVKRPLANRAGSFAGLWGCATLWSFPGTKATRMSMAAQAWVKTP